MSLPGGERWAEILRAREDHARPGPNCPDPDRIWRAVTHDVPVAEREAIIDHTIECGACAEAWRLAAECARSVDVTSRRSSMRGWLLDHRVAASVAAIIALAIVTFVWYGRYTDPELRRPDRDAPQSKLARDVVLPREAALLQWSEGPPGAVFDLIVTTEDLAIVASVRGLDRPEYLLPKERLAAIAPDTRLLWRVIAETPDGRRAASPTFEVIVR